MNQPHGSAWRAELETRRAELHAERHRLECQLQRHTPRRHSDARTLTDTQRRAVAQWMRHHNIDPNLVPAVNGFTAGRWLATFHLMWLGPDGRIALRGDTPATRRVWRRLHAPCPVPNLGRRRNTR